MRRLLTLVFTAIFLTPPIVPTFASLTFRTFDASADKPAVGRSAGLAGGQPAATVMDLGFLTGCWRLEANGRTVEEHWLGPAGGSLIGVGRTVAGGKTVEYEFIQVRELPAGLTYIAKPSNQPEARFTIVAKTADEVVFENPTHDFPQRIRYRRAGSDALHARIEGTMNGKARGIDFPYTRANCQ